MNIFNWVTNIITESFAFNSIEADSASSLIDFSLHTLNQKSELDEAESATYLIISSFSAIWQIFLPL